jgi:hypothetical protein
MDRNVATSPRSFTGVGMGSPWIVMRLRTGLTTELLSVVPRFGRRSSKHGLANETCQPKCTVR